MGEASRRKQRLIRITSPALAASINAVSGALRKLATAASSNLGSDCYLHSALGQVLLADAGIRTRLVAGYAAWRVGPGDGDVIAHTKRTRGYLPPGGGLGFAYHAWLEADGLLIDLTTYQLPRKAEELDAADGGHTTVEWAPPYLVLTLDQVSSYDEVAKGGPGLVYYERDTQVEARLVGGFSLDQGDVEMARLIVSNPEMAVVGPRSQAE